MSIVIYSVFLLVVVKLVLVIVTPTSPNRKYRCFLLGKYKSVLIGFIRRQKINFISKIMM